MIATMRIEAWLVRDTGLLTAPGPFRRLPGAVRHHAARGQAWPDRVTLELTDAELVIAGVGAWSRGEVAARVVAEGPPVTFVLDVPGTSQLLAAPADERTAAVVTALALPAPPPPSA